MPRFLLALLVCMPALAPAFGQESVLYAEWAGEQPEPWTLHTIDNTSRGADGVRLADINRDRRPDIVTGWEEGGVVRVYIHPGYENAGRPWPGVTVGRAPNVEDAVFVDVNLDGMLDVISSTEGEERTIFVHLAPARLELLTDSAAWRTHPLEVTKQRMQWMFALPLRDSNPLKLVLGGKNDEAQLGSLTYRGSMQPVKQEKFMPSEWIWKPWTGVGWIMSILEGDIDGDGDADVVYSDRRGAGKGIWWIENEAGFSGEIYDRRHFIGGGDHEVMFVAWQDLDGDDLRDIVAATAGNELLYFKRLPSGGVRWEAMRIVMPEGVGRGKAVAIGDIDGDGIRELIISCEQATGKIGVFRIHLDSDEGRAVAYDISGEIGTKYDLVQLLDIDGDGDLDVLTCEESENLGVVWYENPG